MPPEVISLREFVVLQNDMKHLREEVDQLRDMVGKMSDNIQEMRKTMDEAKGGWKTVSALIGLSAAVGGIFAKLFMH